MFSKVLAYTGLITTGALKAVALPAGCRTFGVQVSIPSGAITSWSVTLEGSLDNVNWTVLGTHSSTIGSTIAVVDKPVTFVRVNVGSLTLNTAPSISVYAVAVP